MVDVLELLLIGPAVTPEDICVPRHVLHPVAITEWTVCHQLSILVIGEPCEIWWLGDIVALNEEKFGFSCQSRAGVRREELTDGVQVESRAVWVSGEQLGCVRTADDAADEGVHAVMLSLSGDLLQAGLDFPDAQQHVDAYVEVKAWK